MGMKTNRARQPHHPYRGRSTNWEFEIAGRTASGEFRMRGSSDIADLDLHRCLPVRHGHRYPGQRNLEVLHHVLSTAQQVYCESQNEARCLMVLEQQNDLAVVVTQPFVMLAVGGYIHYPDCAIRTGNGVLKVIDFRMRSMPGSQDPRAFDRARDLLASVGVEYELMFGPEGYAASNAEHLWSRRHPRYGFDAETRSRMLRLLARPARFDQVAVTLMPSRANRAREGLRHAMWRQEVITLDDGPFCDRMLIVRRDAQ